MKIGMIFPGQGAQFVGMAKEFYDRERLVQEFFDEASNCLNQNFIKLCFASSEKELMETVNTQTSIFLVSVAIFRLLKEKYGITPQIVAGHSLGEYSALFAAGGLNFPDGLYLLKKRGTFMEEATGEGNQGMLAVINVSQETLKLIVSDFDKPDSDEVVAEIVNFNLPNQLVVSGTTNELLAIKEKVEQVGGKAIILKVSGAFHSRLMSDAAEKFSVYMEKVDFYDLKIPLINNLDAKQIATSQEIRHSLIHQLSAPVLWWQSLQYFADCDIIVEVGPGSKLSKLVARQWPSKKVISINEQEDINQLLRHLDMPIPVQEIFEEPPTDVI